MIINQTKNTTLNEWQLRNLGSMFTVRRGGSPRPIEKFITKKEDGLNWLKIGDIEAGAKYINKTSCKIIKEGLSKTTMVKNGDFILSNSMSFGRPYIMKIDACIHDGWLTFQDIKTKILNRDFLYYLLLHHKTQAIFNSISAGSGVQNLKKETVSNVALLIPPLPEQGRIVAVLETWDKAIDQLAQKIEIKKKIKKGLMQRLLTGKVRLQGFKKGWKCRLLKDVLHEHGENSSGIEEVYSVSVHKGLINQIEHLGRSFSAATTLHYNLVKPGDIVYTKSPTGDFPLGIIKQSRLDKNVIVSPLYGVFTPETFGLGIMLDAYFSSPINIKNYLNSLVQKGAKNTIAITNKVFLSKGVMLPIDKDEQEAIGLILMTAENEINVLRKKMQKLIKQKKYLLNNLITGTIRTPETMKIND